MHKKSCFPIISAFIPSSKCPWGERLTALGSALKPAQVPSVSWTRIPAKEHRWKARLASLWGSPPKPLQRRPRAGSRQPNLRFGPDLRSRWGDIDEMELCAFHLRNLTRAVACSHSKGAVEIRVSFFSHETEEGITPTSRRSDAGSRREP